MQTLSINVGVLSSSKGGYPQSITYNTTPILHMSTGHSLPSSRLSSISGETQFGDPPAACATQSSSQTLPIAKSDIFNFDRALPVLSSAYKRFSGFDGDGGGERGASGGQAVGGERGRRGQ